MNLAVIIVAKKFWFFFDGQQWPVGVQCMLQDLAIQLSNGGAINCCGITVSCDIHEIFQGIYKFTIFAQIMIVFNSRVKFLTSRCQGTDAAEAIATSAKLCKFSMNLHYPATKHENNEQSVAPALSGFHNKFLIMAKFHHFVLVQLSQYLSHTHMPIIYQAAHSMV